MKKNLIFPLLIVYAFLATLTIIYFDGTGDSGDSYVHYQFAKFAPLHPKLYFNLWAKPVFVLLASPFAQLGFVGMKIFNTLVSLLNIFFTYKIIKELKIKNASAGAVILICSPLCFVLTFSGLTEPLFALIICVSIYLTLKKQFISAAIIISFLPFVRSEGLIILSVFAFYFLLKKEWKILPLLLIGKLSHFVVQLLYFVGISIYILFLIGIISIIGDFLRRILTIEFQLLIFLGFLSFFIAHTLFWYFGIFNSMGLKRVLICIAPLISIISLKGFNFLTEEFFIIKNKTGLLI